MCFLVLFIVYFVWTVSTSHGHSYSGAIDSAWNYSRITNATGQTDEYHNFSGSRDSFIPKISSADDNYTEPPYHPRVVMPTHRKQPKRRRKKARNRRRKHRLKHRNVSPNSSDHSMNLTMEPRKNRDTKSSCSDCKIRKRKGRKSRNGGKLSPSLLRKILEKVADDTLSGARSGDGTIMSILQAGSNNNNNNNYKDKGGGRQQDTGTGWSYDQHWVNIASSENIISADEADYQIEENYSSGYLTPWTRWSRCSTTCGAGHQERTRKCGPACTEVESMVCLKPKCLDGSMDMSSSTITEFYKWEQEGFVPPIKLPGHDDLDHNSDVCGSWVKCNRNIAQDFIRNASLPGCPCFFPLLRQKSKNIFDVTLDTDVTWMDSSRHRDLVYKPGARNCMRSTLSKGTRTLAVQHCCYDDNRMLVTRGSAAGTPLLISPDISERLHYKVDLLPWIICKGDWTRYQQVMSPDNTFSCRNNPDDVTVTWQRKQIGNY